MGFQGFFFARIDHADYKQRVKSSALEMVWTPSPLVSGEGADIFTGVLYNGYFPPFGFCFDINCDDPPIQVRIGTEIFILLYCISYQCSDTLDQSQHLISSMYVHILMYTRKWSHSNIASELIPIVLLQQ